MNIKKYSIANKNSIIFQKTSIETSFFMHFYDKKSNFLILLTKNNDRATIKV